MLKEGEDYYINEGGNLVFTEAYHLKRGYCCENKCLHCPWKFGKPKDDTEINRFKNQDIRIKKA